MRKLLRAAAAIGVLAALAVPAAASASARSEQAADKCSTATSATACPAWGGYIGSPKAGSTLRYASASFVIPKVNCAKAVGKSKQSTASFWVGFDGAAHTPGARTVEQAGVIAQCSSRKGKPIYGAFYEMFQGRYQRAIASRPQLPKSTDGHGILHAGDAVSASVSYVKASKTYTFTFADSANDKSWTRTAKCMTSTRAHPHPSKCANSTADVITEAPGGGPNNGNSVPDMGTVKYSAQVSLAGQDYAYGFGLLRVTYATMSPRNHSGLVTASKIIDPSNLNTKLTTTWHEKAAS